MSKIYLCPDCDEPLTYAPINQCWYECDCGYRIDEAIVELECEEFKDEV